MAVNQGVVKVVGGPNIEVGGQSVTAGQITTFAGPDKLVGQRILSATSLRVLYWENVKSLDVQRMANSIVVSIEDETQEQIGLGRETFKDVEVHGVLYLMENAPQTLADEAALEGYLQAIHDAVTQYSPYTSAGTDFVGGGQVVWVKITNEKRAEEVRGIILYEITFEVRLYLTSGTVTPYQQQISDSSGMVKLTGTGIVMASLMQFSGLMRVMAQFLSGLPPGAAGPWNIVPFVTTKSIDLQRAGNTIAIGAPTGGGRVIGFGIGQMGGAVYTQQQVTDYTFKLTMWAASEQDMVAATDWIAANSVLYFLNMTYDQGIVVLSKVKSFGQYTKERGVWWRTLGILVEVVIGV